MTDSPAEEEKDRKARIAASLKRAAQGAAETAESVGRSVGKGAKTAGEKASGALSGLKERWAHRKDKDETK